MSGAQPQAPRPPLAISLLRLARPVQWSKSAFVLFAPLYHLRDQVDEGLPFVEALTAMAPPALAAAAAFALASSGCYVINDMRDREADRAHPRKRNRPIAAGHVSAAQAYAFAAALFVASAALVLVFIPREDAGLVGAAIGAYVANVIAYSLYFKHKVIADVMSLSLGFVLRVVGGALAIGISPTVWLLNVVFFLSMFLAFGKRLGERKAFARGVESEEGVGLAVSHRRVQGAYTDNVLSMAVVVTAVATLMTYALYVEAQAVRYVNEAVGLLWLTLLPATYGLLRCMVMLDRGEYDDPTELAVRDRGVQAAGFAFALITAALFVWSTWGQAGAGTTP